MAKFSINKDGTITLPLKNETLPANLLFRPLTKEDVAYISSAAPETWEAEMISRLTGKDRAFVAALPQENFRTAQQVLSLLLMKAKRTLKG